MAFAPAVPAAVVAAQAAVAAGTATSLAVPLAATGTALAAGTATGAAVGGGAAATAAGAGGFLGLSATGWGTVFAGMSTAASIGATGMQIVEERKMMKDEKNLAREAANSDELARRQKLRQGLSALRVGTAAGNLDLNSASVGRIENASERTFDAEQGQANYYERVRQARIRQRKYAATYGGIARAGISLGSAFADYLTA